MRNKISSALVPSGGKRLTILPFSVTPPPTCFALLYPAMPIYLYTFALLCLYTHLILWPPYPILLCPTPTYFATRCPSCKWIRMLPLLTSLCHTLLLWMYLRGVQEAGGMNDYLFASGTLNR